MRRSQVRNIKARGRNGRVAGQRLQHAHRQHVVQQRHRQDADGVSGPDQARDQRQRIRGAQPRHVYTARPQPVLYHRIQRGRRRVRGDVMAARMLGLEWVGGDAQRGRGHPMKRHPADEHVADFLAGGGVGQQRHVELARIELAVQHRAHVHRHFQRQRRVVLFQLRDDGRQPHVGRAFIGAQTQLAAQRAVFAEVFQLPAAVQRGLGMTQRGLPGVGQRDALARTIKELHIQRAFQFADAG